MNRRLASALLLLFTAMIFFLTVPQAPAQQPGPTETKGMAVVNTTVSDLGPEIEGMQGRQLRMRVLVMDEGGTIAVHEQTDRPEVIYVLNGRIAEHLNGSVIQRNSGDTWTAGKGTTHGIVNIGTEPAVIVVADILKVQ